MYVCICVYIASVGVCVCVRGRVYVCKHVCVHVCILYIASVGFIRFYLAPKIDDDFE